MRRIKQLAAAFVFIFAARLPAAPPNLIVINVDDMGYADIEPFGSKINRTPNLNRMAEEGRKLTCYYAAPVCSPSRASLMTGCYYKRVLPIPHVLFPGNDVGLNPNEITIAEILKKQGYATGMVGKWHLGDQQAFLPTRQGFDFYFGLPYSNDMGPAEDGTKSSLGAPLPKEGKNHQPPLPWLMNEKVIMRVKADDQTTLEERYTEEALKFIKAHKDGPFFLYFAHSAVHFPIYPGKAFQKRNPNGYYSDWVEEVDWTVGQVMDTLRDLGLDKNTFVLFTSDNGGTPRAVNAPLRGFKNSTWEGGVREPTIAWWPGKIPAGTSSDAVVGMIDVLPTLAKLAGTTAPTDRKIDGVDIWPILAGEKDAKPAHDVFYYFHGYKLEAVREGKWKYHLLRKELYDLDADIGESKNIAAENKDVVKHMIEVADKMDGDLGLDGTKAPGIRPLGHVKDAHPIIAQDGEISPEFK
ncbi:MAG: sulfatase-like hydrolase/transferase [Planctomycetes bacterium]|nr:sulfatase-like hydrolase/transferase [Planctomycetota bacterium]